LYAQGSTHHFHIQQTSHKWIEGVEKEKTYAQAIKSLRVVLTDIQHGPKVLQRFKTTHEPSKLYLVLKT
jgi:hypothetical protein